MLAGTSDGVRKSCTPAGIVEESFNKTCNVNSVKLRKRNRPLNTGYSQRAKWKNRKARTSDGVRKSWTPVGIVEESFNKTCNVNSVKLRKRNRPLNTGYSQRAKWKNRKARTSDGVRKSWTPVGIVEESFNKTCNVNSVKLRKRNRPLNTGYSQRAKWKNRKATVLQHTDDVSTQSRGKNDTPHENVPGGILPIAGPSAHCSSYLNENKDKRNFTHQLAESISEAQSDDFATSCPHAEEGEKSFKKALRKFKLMVNKGPDHVCCCCGSLWFQKSVRLLRAEFVIETYGIEFFKKINRREQERTEICYACSRQAYRGKVLPVSLENGIGFQPLPDELKGLSALEERLVALRIPFMQIRPLGVDRQLGLR
ncbi:unnamed protein product [Allacma fusca]|uniref:DUF6570 domain-containing protein n=1 Tax=Allacma fusca TaxID=39272 RepID=A0A8J2JF87_9HEXA|nr:unnamed protein product [Allacma fusca]